jgi:hypothetical protein
METHYIQAVLAGRIMSLADRITHLEKYLKSSGAGVLIVPQPPVAAGVKCPLTLKRKQLKNGIHEHK